MSLDEIESASFRALYAHVTWIVPDAAMSSLHAPGNFDFWITAYILSRMVGQRVNCQQ